MCSAGVGCLLACLLSTVKLSSSPVVCARGSLRQSTAATLVSVVCVFLSQVHLHGRKAAAAVAAAGGSSLTGTGSSATTATTTTTEASFLLASPRSHRRHHRLRAGSHGGVGVGVGGRTRRRLEHYYLDDDDDDDDDDSLTIGSETDPATGQASRALRLQIPGLPWERTFDSYKKVAVSPPPHVGSASGGRGGTGDVGDGDGDTAAAASDQRHDFVYSGLTLSHPDVGSVAWLEPVSLRNSATGKLIDLRDVVKMGVDPATLRPFIALFWNFPAPPEGTGLNKRVRVSLKGQFAYVRDIYTCSTCSRLH